MTHGPIILPFKGVMPTIDPSAVIMPGAVVIGNVHIGAQSSVWPGVVIRGDINQIYIGQRTNIQDGSIVHVTREAFASAGDGSTWIGDDVTIGHNAVIHGCRLEDQSFVGMSATVMDGATVESRAMVAAGAMVTYRKVIETGQIWAGNPAKFFRQMTQQETDYIPSSAAHYVLDAQAYV